jgi:dynein heavy chain
LGHPVLYRVFVYFVFILQELPVTQTPEVFGMHDNVDIAKELQETRQLFNSVLLTQSQKSSGGGGKKGDEALLEIAKDILSKVSGFLHEIKFLLL